MWRPWSKSSSKFSDVFSFSSPKRHHEQPNNHHLFRCSSFKDVENLFSVDNLSNLNNFDDFDSCFTPPAETNPNTFLKRQTQTQTRTRTHRSISNRVRAVKSLLRQWSIRSDPHSQDETPITPKTPKRETRIVVYYTSLRVVRPTFEACRKVMSILHGLQVVVDERDVVMDLGFISELREFLGLKPNEELTLPRVFIGGRYIGGADEIVRLHEMGELKKLVSGVPRKKPGTCGTCGTCGGYRFILCSVCSGSHKTFSKKVGFRSCKECNENGLIRCPDCSSPPLCRPILASLSHTNGF